MDNCTLRIVLIVICCLLILIGIIIAFTREKKELKAGTSTVSTGSFDPTNGGFKLSGNIGPIMIFLGLAAVLAVAKFVPDCSSKVADNAPATVKHAIVEGWVKEDGESGAYVPGALISIAGRKETGITGSDGHFKIELEDHPDEVSVIVKAAGYREDPPVIVKTDSVADYLIHKQ